MLGYQGGFQYYLYNHLFKQICHPLKALGAFSYKPYIKVFLDQGIHHPFAYFPVFYTLKAMVEGHSDPFLHAKRKYENEIWDSCKTLWMIWVPCQVYRNLACCIALRFAWSPRGLSFTYCSFILGGGGGGGPGAQVVNFMFVPSHMTIPFVCGVSFGWTTVLSVMQSAYDQLHEQETVLVSGQLDQAIASPIPPAEGRVLFAGRTGTAAAMTPQRGVGLQEIARAKDGENV